MKKLLILVGALVAMMCLAWQGFTGTVAGWDFSAIVAANNFGASPYAAATSDPNATIGGLTRNWTLGSGTPAGAAWGGNNFVVNGTEAQAISAGNYVTFTIAANAGFQVSLADIAAYNIRRSASGPGTGIWQYSLNGGSSYTDIGSAITWGTVTTATGNPQPSISLAGISALQNVQAGTTITFRLVTWGATGNTGTWYLKDLGNSTTSDLVIEGTVSAASTVASQVFVETAADGSGVVVSAETINANTPQMVYAISRTAGGTFVGNVSGTWSLTGITGGVVAGDLVASGDGKSATFTGHGAGSAVIHVVSGSLTSVDSGTITVNAAPIPPSGVGAASPAAVLQGSNVLLTVTVTPGANPASTGLSVTADLSSIGGSSSQAFHDDGLNGDAVAGDGVFSFSTIIPTSAGYGPKTLAATITDGQGRSGNASISLNFLGNLTIIHANDTHARVTPHQWIVPQHSTNPATAFEAAGGAAYLGGEMLQLTANQPDALVLDGGDISEGNPVGDWNGPGTPVDTFGNGTIVEYFKLLDTKLRAIPGRNGRGLDAMVVGNHDIRDISYLNNLMAQTSFPVISINICSNGTHSPYFKPYVILNVNGHKIGVIGYTTETSDSPESVVNSTISVVQCDWSSTDSTKIHFADYVNELRVANGCDLVILLTHDGHSDLCTSSSGSTPILVDGPQAKLPEVAITGHWHTYSDTVWQPSVLNYKTIFTEEGSFMHYVGTLQINGLGKYQTNINYPIRDSAITPDPDIAALIQTRKDEWNLASTSANPTNYTLDQIIGYTADDLLLDNLMKWWSSDEFPWSGNNTAGNWICDGVQWKAAQLFGQCDVAMESGGGVRSDIPAGPVTYTQIYETYPWADDLIYEVNMTGQEIWNYIQQHGCDVGISRGWLITGHDGVPTSITVNGQPINLSHTYKVGINNYMYIHDSVPFSDPSPQTSTTLARSALVEFTAQYPQSSPYNAGDSRYSLDTEFSGGYRAVVTMMNDADSSTAFDDGFIRFLSANDETLGHRGTKQVPTNLVNADGTFVKSNRLGEIELYRSYLGFRTNVLKPGDIIETWGKGSFFDGDPEFVDQEGIYADGVEFKIVGHDDSLALPAFVPNIATVLDDWHKNHYVQFLARKTGTSSVVDQQGTPLAVQDVTAFNSKTLPGNNGDLLLLTGVPTSENFSMRFRCGSAVLASTAGFSGFPPASAVDPVSPYVQSAPVLHLTAQAAVESPTQTVLTPVADTEVASATAKANSNFSTSTSMFIQSAATGSFGNERAWVKFNLAGLSIPSGAVITNVQFKLYCFSASTAADLPAEVRGVTDDSWTETGLTWNNQPSPGPALDTNTLALGVENLYYSWNVTAFATNELAHDQVASFVAKPVTENAATSVSYAMDTKEFGGGATAPQLEFDYTSVSTNGAGVSQVQFQYRYSPDNSTWTAWNALATDTAVPYAADFSYPNGYGYYEFRSIATGTDGNVEPAPFLADASVFYTNNPPLAGDYTMGCARNSSNTLAVAKLLKVCSDPDGDAISVIGVSSPSANNAAVTLSGGTVLYVPAFNFAGPDSFTYTLRDARGATATGTVTVSVTVPTGSGPSVLHVIPGASGTTIQFAGVPGQNYDIEASTDLVNWQSIGTATAGANGLYEFVDANAGSFPQRYYRARMP